MTNICSEHPVEAGMHQPNQHNDPHPASRELGVGRHHDWSMDPIDLEEFRETLVRETRGQYIVSSDPVKFMYKFLPFNERKEESYQKFRLQKVSKTRIQHLKSMVNAKTEKEMYGHFVSISGLTNSTLR